MTRAVTAFLLLFVLAVHAEEFTVRGPEPGLQAGFSKQLRIASSHSGALAVWMTSRLLAARMSSGGEVLDPVALEISRSDLSDPFVVASDGTDYLVAHGARLTRISAATGQMTPLPDWSPTYAIPLTLTWNGRVWLLQFSRNYRTHSVLLDRDGAVISGTLAHWRWTVESVASHEGSWLVVGDGFLNSPTLAGIVTESDFPPLGGERRLVLPMLFPPGVVHIAVAADRDGYVSVRSHGYRQKPAIVLQRLAVVDDLRPGQRFSALTRRVEPVGEPVVIAEEADGAEVSLAADDGRAMVVFDRHNHGPTPRMALVEGSRVTELPLEALEAQAAFTRFGPLAVAVTRGDGQVRVVFPATGELVSKAYQTFENLRIMAGGGAHLATWSERRDLQVASYFALLDGAGRPLAPPVRFGESWGSPARLLGFSGRTFLMISGRSALQVSLDGTILNRAALPDVDDRYTSLSWRDGRYFLTAGPRVLRLAEDGTPLDPAPFDPQLGGERLWLAANEDGFVAVTRSFYRMACTCPLYADTAVYLLDGDLRRRRTKYTAYDYSGAIALAAGGEEYLFVWDRLYTDPVPHRLLSRTGERRPDYGGRHVALDAVWTGSGFLVRAGNRVAHHTALGELLRIDDLGADVLESAVSASGVALTLRQRPADANVITASRLPP